MKAQKKSKTKREAPIKKTVLRTKDSKCSKCNGSGKVVNEFTCLTCEGTGISIKTKLHKKMQQQQQMPLVHSKGYQSQITQYRQPTFQKEITGTFESVKRKVTPKDTAKNKIRVMTRWGEIGFPVSSIDSFQSTLPKLPYSLFTQISGYLEWCALEHSSEGRVDLTLINDQWVAICFYQSAEGQLDVTVKFDQEENQALLTDEIKAALANIHCTIHSHTFSSAFQSGTDERDEMDKNGWHITLGEYGSGKVGNHARYTVRENPKRNEAGEKITQALNFFFQVEIQDIVEIPDEFELTPSITGVAFPKRKDNKKPDYHVFNYVSDFPEEWKERFHKNKTKVFQYPPKKEAGFHAIGNEDYNLLDEGAWKGKIKIVSAKDQEEKEAQENMLMIQEFEKLTKLDFNAMSTMINTLLEAKNPVNTAAKITEWLVENSMADKMEYIPTFQNINLILYQAESDKYIALDIAEEIILNAY